MPSKASKHILVTGFSPFGGETINPSWELVRGLPDVMAGHRIEKLRVPTEFGQSIVVVTAAIDKLKPALVLCFGQAGGRAGMSVERIAINIDDARIPDNAGVQAIDQPIRSDGAAAYFATVPIKSMVAAMHKAGIPAEVSNSAGTFVCNHLMYGVLHHIARHRYSTRAGFIHVPYLEAQVAGQPQVASMSLATMVAGAKATIMAAVKRKTDLKLIGGKLD